LFKFIVSNENEKIARVGSLFDENCELIMHPSSKGNYISITVKEVMMSAHDIIRIYEKAAEIKGVIVL
jgi:putative lipoic acid-binding regulatory protein